MMVLGTEVGLNPGDFVLDGDPAPPPKGDRAPSSILGPFLLWPNGWMDQDATWYKGRPRVRRHCVRWGPSSPFPKRGLSPLPNFRPMSIVAKRLDGSRWHLAWRWALVQATLCQMDSQLPSPKRGICPQFLAHFYCGQTAGCIKMPLGMVLGLSLGDIVLHGDPAPPPLKGHSPLPQFSANVRCGQTAGWTTVYR